MKKRVAVIGHGYVGVAVANFFHNHFDIVVVDPKYIGEEGYGHNKQKEEANKADLAVVCVPTPMGEDGSVDLTFIDETFKWLKDVPNILVKSTIPPGTTDYINERFFKGDNRVCFSPEFIGEGNYVIPWWKDVGYPHPTAMEFHDFQIVGGDKKKARQILSFFQRVTGPDPKYMVTDAKTAELCKYMENSFIATKVTFCNEFAKMAEAFGVDYGELRELWLLDGRVGRMYTSVFEDKRGFGGKCLPKDVNGIYQQAKKVGYDAEFIKAVLDSNERLKTNQS